MPLHPTEPRIVHEPPSANLCPACSKPLPHPLVERCPACGAIRRIGDILLLPLHTLRLAQHVARTGYPWDAYDFVLRSFPRVHARLRGSLRVHAGLSAAEICHGLVEHARTLFGPHAADVLASLRLERSEDIGTIIYGLADHGLLKIEETDRPEDFANVLDVRTALAAPPPNPT
jgi:uncharacterized repeat protein (TIGR04138 family)